MGSKKISYVYLSIILLLSFSTFTLAGAKKNFKPRAQSVQLTKSYSGEMSSDPHGPYRWLDIANNLYGLEYMEDYDYSQATVNVEYKEKGETFKGTLEAWNLKPNFAYQLKLEGYPLHPSNELIGYTGRWWYTTTQGASGNCEDAYYEENKGDSEHTFIGYLVFDYFITDETGYAYFEFEQDSSYHVLWKPTQRPPAPNDGPIKTHSFNPEPDSPAYDTDPPSSTIGVYGEVEREPVGGKHLPEGTYLCKVFLTEESFHGHGGLYSGSWAGVMEGEVSYKIETKRTGPDKPHPPHPHK